MKEQYALHMVRSMPDHSVCIYPMISDIRYERGQETRAQLGFLLLIAEKLGRESAKKVSYHTVDSRIRVDEGRRTVPRDLMVIVIYNYLLSTTHSM